MSNEQFLPYIIDSSLLSAQTRKRLYWTNIENISTPEDKGLVYNDIKEDTYDDSLVISNKFKPNLRGDTLKKKNKSHRLGGYMKQGQGQRVYSLNGKSVCLSALGGGWGAKTGLYLDNGVIRKPTITELCRLQTVPEDYFDKETYNEIAKMIGNGWTIDVIVHILKELKSKEMRNIISLFDGMSCGQIALQRANITYDNYYSSEIDKHAIKVTQANFPDTIQLGDIQNWREWDIDWSTVDLVIGGSPCFVAGTKVITTNGYKNIEDIIIGDEVLTHENRFKKVLRTGGDIKDTVILKAQGIKPTETTLNHPYYVREMQHAWNSDTKNQERVFSKPKWKEVKDIKKGDFIGLPILNIEENPRNLSKEQCWLIGRYIADGHYKEEKRKNRKNSYQYAVIYSIGNDKINEFVDRIKENKFTYYEHTQSTYRCCFYSMDFVTLLKELKVGKGAINKNFSMELLKLPKNLLKEVIAGYMSGDGTKTPNSFKATSISEELILSFNLAIAKVYETNSSYEKVKVTSTKVIKGRVVKQNPYYNSNFRKEMKKQSNAKVIDDIVWLPIKEILSANNNTRVYNLEVEDDNSYTANNVIVHNCQGFSFSGKQLNFNDPRSKLFFEFAEVLSKAKKHNPNVKFLLENVKMKKEFEEIINKILYEIIYNDLEFDSSKYEIEV